MEATNHFLLDPQAWCTHQYQGTQHIYFWAHWKLPQPKHIDKIKVIQNLLFSKSMHKRKHMYKKNAEKSIHSVKMKTVFKL